MNPLRRFLPTAFLLPVMLMAGAARGATSAARHPNILLVTLDTTRQDAVGCYREAGKSYLSLGTNPGDPSATPTLDALCARGRKYTRAYTTAPITLPAHASILTGLYSPQHGVHDNGMYALPDDIPTLPEILRRNGYQTAAAVSSIVLSRHYGLSRGFAEYDDHLGSHEERNAGQTVDAALKLMTRVKKNRPWFLWIHLYDPHGDYQAPEPWKSRFPPYLAEVAYMDHELGRLMDTLNENRRLDGNTLIVVAGDHGESLGEHGEMNHGIFLYEATLRIPLLFAGAGITPTTDSSLVSLVDVLPAILNYSLVGVKNNFHGDSAFALQLRQRASGNRAPVSTAADSPGRFIFAESELPMNSLHWAPLYAVIGLAEGDLCGAKEKPCRIKYILAPQPEIYNLDQDTEEMNNRAPAIDAGQWRGFSGRLDGYQAHARRKFTLAEDAATRQSLQRLGYTSGPTPVADSLPRPDPKEMIRFLPDLNRAHILAQEGHCPQVIALLQNILKHNPGNASAMSQLGGCYNELKNPRAAISIYSEALKLYPTLEFLHFQLGVSLRDAGDGAGAEREWRETLRLNPRHALAATGLIQSARLAGRIVEAEAVLSAARKARIEDSGVEGEAGLLAVAKKDWTAAEKSFATALRFDPKNVAARVNLATLYYGRKEISKALRLYAEGLGLLPGEGQFLRPAAAILLEKCQGHDRCPEAPQAVRYLRQYLENNPAAPDAPQVRAILKNIEAMPH